METARRFFRRPSPYAPSPHILDRNQRREGREDEIVRPSLPAPSPSHPPKNGFCPSCAEMLLRPRVGLSPSIKTTHHSAAASADDAAFSVLSRK